MSNTSLSPNMGLPVPNVSVAPSPEWAQDLNASLAILDSHNHSPGQGEQITSAGINITSDFALNGNNLTAVKSTRYSPQGSPLSGGSDVGCAYVSGADLYFNDVNGNQVRITQSGSVAGSTGTITGLPSGTASASFSGGTFTFQSATLTPANMNVGPIAIGRNATSSKTVTLSPASGQSGNYTLTFPAAAPLANQFLTSDNSGNLAWSFGQMQLGMVCATFPNLTGAYVCSTTANADAYGFVKCNGSTISDANSPLNGQTLPNLNNSVFIQGSTTAGTSGGAASVTLSSANLAAHTHTFTGTSVHADTSHNHSFNHDHQALFWSAASDGVWGAATSSSSQATWTTGETKFGATTGYTSGSGAHMMVYNTGGASYTSGVLNSVNQGSGVNGFTGAPTSTNAPTGTNSSTGSGTSFAILPTFISAVYVMRIR